MTWRMPAESEPHERTWMAYPSAGYSLGDTAEEQHEARSTWAAVAHAVAEFEPVTVVVDPAEVEDARKYLSEKVDIVEAPLNDAWMRDIGPTFVLSDEGRLGGVDWVFNGWGAQDWAQWDKDSKIGAFVVEQSGAQLIDSPIVNEGGGIAVDGLGTVLVTETVQLDPGRNPDLTKARHRGRTRPHHRRQARDLASPRIDSRSGDLRNARTRRHRRCHLFPRSCTRP